jgi:apolipoprotein N-acyltransferase
MTEAPRSETIAAQLAGRFGATDVLPRLVGALSGWRRLLAATLLGVGSVLAMPPFGLWPLWFLTFPGFVLLLDGVSRDHNVLRRLRAAALSGWFFGFGYLVPGLYWIGSAFLVESEKFAVLMPFAITLLPAYLAIYFGLAASAAMLAWRSGPWRVLALAGAFGISEWLRGHLFTGFPWNALGYGLTIDPRLAQTASIVGVTGLAPWAVLIFASPVLLLPTRENSRRDAFFVVAAFTCLALAYLWGLERLSFATEDFVSPPIKLRLVQPNTPEADKFVPGSQRRIFDTIMALSRRDSSGADDNLEQTNVLVWPEEPLNFLLLDSTEALSEIGAMLKGRTMLLTGAIRLQPEITFAAAGPRSEVAGPPPPGFYNSLAAIDGTGHVQMVFDKRHLVPFGEYLPFETVLEALGFENLNRAKGGLRQGSNPRRLQVAGLPEFSPLICYEIIFPDEVIAAGSRPEWLLNVTNDAWFGISTGPYQHLHTARMRAIEQGLPLVRAAITGISAIVDPYGRNVSSAPLGVAETVNGQLPVALTPTPYARYGDGMLVIELLAGVLVLACGVFLRGSGR